MFVLFSDLYNQPYTFKNKIKSKRRLIWRTRKGLWYGLHYGLHLLNCTFTVSVVEPETVSSIYDDRPLYKLLNCVFVPAGKSNNAEFTTVYTL